MRQLKAGKGTSRFFKATSHADLRPHIRERHQNLPAHQHALLSDSEISSACAVLQEKKSTIVSLTHYNFPFIVYDPIYYTLFLPKVARCVFR